MTFNDTRPSDVYPQTAQTVSFPKELRNLLSGGAGGRSRVAADSAWDLHHRREDDGDSDSESDDDSIASAGSSITVNIVDLSLPSEATNIVTPVTPASPLPVANRSFADIALEETPPEKRAVKRKAPDDCHVIIRWSQLACLIKENMNCSGCGKAITKLERRTVGIATEIDFSCPCRETVSASADLCDYMLEQTETNFLRRERRIDNYDLNWRLLMATQLMGESQIGGSIVALFLDLTRDAFRANWGPMEDALGVEQRRIAQEVVDSNLKRETLGKEAILCDDGKIRYPISVSYDMGWRETVLGNETEAD
jgi:hypothetical protein